MLEIRRGTKEDIVQVAAKFTFDTHIIKLNKNGYKFWL